MDTGTCLAIIFSMIIIGETLGLILGNLSKKAFAQSSAELISHKPITLSEQEKTVIPKPESKTNLNMPSRTIKIDRVGTAFKGRNSISIKSTDAGIVPRYQPIAGCDNCGIVDFVNVIGQGGIIGTITGGIIGGTIARKIGKYGSRKYSNTDTSANGSVNTEHTFERDTANRIIHYDVGVTMNDGTQSIITLPNEPRFNNGDRIKLIDGVLVPEH